MSDPKPQDQLDQKLREIVENHDGYYVGSDDGVTAKTISALRRVVEEEVVKELEVCQKVGQRSPGFVPLANYIDNRLAQLKPKGGTENE